MGWGWGALRTRRHCCAEHTRAHHSAHRCLPPRGCLACAQLKDVQPKMQEDLTLPNHLSGLRKKYLQLRFDSCRDLMTVRKTILRRSMPTRAHSAAAPQRRRAAGPGRSQHSPQSAWLHMLIHAYICCGRG